MGVDECFDFILGGLKKFGREKGRGCHNTHLEEDNTASVVLERKQAVCSTDTD